MARVEASSLESLQVLLQQNPDSLTFAHVADVLLKSGRVDDATRICEEGIRRHPYYVTGHMVLGKCYLEKKQFDQAEKEFKRVLLFDPKHLAAHKYFGDLMRAMGWDNTCETSYKKILQIDPLDETAQAVLDELSNMPSKPSAIDLTPTIAEQEKPAVAKTGERETGVVVGIDALDAEPRGATFPEAGIEPVIGDSDFKSLRPQREPQPPATTSPFDDNDLFAAASAEEQRLLNPPGPADMASQPPLPAPGREMDEDKFSSILDDIFQDEVVDDRQRLERPPQIEPQQPGADFERDFGFSEAFPNAAPETPQPARPRTPARPSPEDFDDEILGPPQRNERPAFTANLSDEETPSGMGDDRASFMDIDGLEPEPPENSLPAEETPFRRDAAVPRGPMANLPRSMARPGSDTEARKMFETSLPRAGAAPVSEREKIVTPTLGEIYAAQGQFAKAIGVFELLLRKDPNNAAYRDKIEYLKKRLQETEHAG